MFKGFINSDLISSKLSVLKSGDGNQKCVVIYRKRLNFSSSLVARCSLYFARCSFLFACCSLIFSHYFLSVTCKCLRIIPSFLIISLNLSLKLCSLCSHKFQCGVVINLVTMIRGLFLFINCALSIKICSFTQIFRSF